MIVGFSFGFGANCKPSLRGFLRHSGMGLPL